MIATIVMIDVLPEYVDAFIEITKYNCENSRKEAANIRFDLLRDNKAPNKFMLYEVFEDEAAVARHKETEHYNKWRETVEPMMASRRVGIPTTPLFFS